MKESDYINATDLGKITALRSVLEALRPVENSNVVYENEFKEVLRIIAHWQNRAFKLITKDKTEKWFFNNCLSEEPNSTPR